MSTVIIRSAALTSSRATGSMLGGGEGGAGGAVVLNNAPDSPASDTPDSPMLSGTPVPLLPLKLTPSAQGELRSTASAVFTSDEELDAANNVPEVAALPLHTTPAAAPSAATIRRGVRWPNRRGATAGLPPCCDAPRTVAVPLPDPRAMTRETEPAVTKPRNNRAKSIRWPARRGASAGLGHTIVASQYSVIDVPVTQ